MKNMFVCMHCQEPYPREELYEVNGDLLCLQCAEELTLRCERCGERIYESDSHGDMHITLCETCYENHYVMCNDCGRVISYDYAYYLNDNDDVPYCSSCYEDHEDDLVIHEYNYVPELVFHGKGNRYYGVELEIDGGGKRQNHAVKILESANLSDENLYIKTDGSLNDGLELVTHPMSLDYHLNIMPWEAILKEARSLGYVSHKADTCGLHIHISRTAFGNSYDMQEASIARLLFFVEKFWPELLRFSRRTQSQLDRWARRYGLQLYPREVLDHAKNSSAGRYTAVNLINAETVEIRLFRGTLKLNTLIATLQMVNAMCDVAVFMSDEDLRNLSWHDFLFRIHYGELISYLKERQLYVNEPVIVEEDA